MKAADHKSTAITAVENAMSAAFSLYAETMGEAFPTAPKLLIHPDAEFWASAKIFDDEFVVTISDGLVATLSAYWAKAFADPEINIGGTVDEMLHLSLTWLMLHELHHYQMGHFVLTGRLSLTEAKDGNSFGLASRKNQALPEALKNINKQDLPNVEPCLELQADHDASEMLIDAYSPDKWEIIQTRVAAISAMMVLIEREDAKLGHDLSAHPKAATRIFQLLGHVIEMPMIEATITAQHPELNITPRIPPEDEQSAYNRAVVIPAFLDAVELARIAGAETITTDLGTPQAFFEDMQIAKLADPAHFGSLKTKGATQWAKLVILNGVLLPKLESIKRH